jgi:Fe2+ transport system protein FeoA
MNAYKVTSEEMEGRRPGRRISSLDTVQPGKMVRIKKLCAGDETDCRLREIGVCEGQIIRLIARHASLICQVCNTRLALNAGLGRAILVEWLS